MEGTKIKMTKHIEAVLRVKKDLEEHGAKVKLLKIKIAPLLARLPKKIKINHPFIKEASLKETRGERYNYCWYQAGPFEIKCGVGKSKGEAREELNRWLSKRDIGKGRIWDVCYKVKRKVGKHFEDDWWVYD